MNKSKYHHQLAAIRNAYESEKIKLQDRYAKSITKYKVGDIIRDHRKTILVQEILTVLDENPDKIRVDYNGVKLDKNLEPVKNSTPRVVLMESEIELIIKK